MYEYIVHYLLRVVAQLTQDSHVWVYCSLQTMGVFSPTALVCPEYFQQAFSMLVFRIIQQDHDNNFLLNNYENLFSRSLLGGHHTLLHGPHCLNLLHCTENSAGIVLYFSIVRQSGLVLDLYGIFKFVKLHYIQQGPKHKCLCFLTGFQKSHGHSNQIFCCSMYTVLWIRIQIESVFSNLVDQDPN